jgi:hypothetical protein
MAVTSGFFNAIDHDRLYNAEDVGSLLDGIITDGILNTYGSHFEVTISNGLDILVGSGRGWFKQTWIKNDDNLVLTAEANTTGDVRYDTVVIDINKTDAIRANSIQIVTGTSNPSGPTLIDEAAHKQYPIANLKIDATGTEIAEVIDRRDEVYAQNPAVLKPYWPIGSVFMTLDINFDPTVSFGGVWEQISGKFLLGCGGDSGLNAGDTGGSWEHTITTDNLPSHNHGTGTLGTSGVQLTPKLHRIVDGLQINYVMGWPDTEGTSRGGSNTSNYLPASWNYPYSYQGAQNMSEEIHRGPSAAVTDEIYISMDSHSHTVYGNTANTGNGRAITIKPPYLAVYMWKRIS